MEMNIGNKIRELRKKKGITQEQLASALGITSQAVSKWEMSTGYPDIAMLPVIAGYFGVSMDTLFNYDADKLEENIMNVLYHSRGGKPFEEAEKILLEGIAIFPARYRLTCHEYLFGKFFLGKSVSCSKLENYIFCCHNITALFYCDSIIPQLRGLGKQLAVAVRVSLSNAAQILHANIPNPTLQSPLQTLQYIRLPKCGYREFREVFYDRIFYHLQTRTTRRQRRQKRRKMFKLGSGE